MNRLEFLKSLGMSGAAIFALTCLGGLQSCGSSSNPAPAPVAVDFTLDLNEAPNTVLKTNGGFIIKNQTVVARTNTGAYMAVTQVCSHENNVAIAFSARDNEFVCSVHGARYTPEGRGLNAEGAKGLTAYKTTLNGNSLRVFA